MNFPNISLTKKPEFNTAVVSRYLSELPGTDALRQQVQKAPQTISEACTQLSDSRYAKLAMQAAAQAQAEAEFWADQAAELLSQQAAVIASKDRDELKADLLEGLQIALAAAAVTAVTVAAYKLHKRIAAKRAKKAAEKENAEE